MITELMGEDVKVISSAKILVGEAVIKPCSMRNCEGPEPNIISPIRGPANGRVDHHGPCPVTERFNCPFSTSVLMFGTNTRKGLCLFLVSTIIAKCFRDEETIIRVIMLGQHTIQVPTPIFKSSFPNNSFSCTKRNLILHTNQIGDSILEDGTTMLAIVQGLLTIPLLEASWGFNHILIT